MLTALLIDDETRARRVMRSLLTDYCEGIEVVADCADVPDGVKAIHRTCPDVVFCDIEMPGHSGLELLEFFRKPAFELVFATGYSEYAVRAFELSAVDYLLKPIQIRQLQRCVQRIRERRSAPQPTGGADARLDVLAGHLTAAPARKLALPVSDGLLFVEVANLVLLEADGAYTTVWQADGSATLVSKKLRFFEDYLGTHPAFFRSHRSAMINLDHLTRYVRADSLVYLGAGKTAPIARQKKAEFEVRIANLRL